MENQEKTLLSDKMITTGLVAVAISYIIFLITGGFFEKVTDVDLGIFFVNYIITVCYTVAFWKVRFTNRQTPNVKINIHHTIITLILWLISAFSLNREMNVFDDSVMWLSVLITVFSVAFITTIFSKNLNHIIRHIVFFFVAVGIILFIYYSFYLSIWYIISVPASIILGISLHSFVPIIIVVTAIKLFIINIKTYKTLKYTLTAGLILPIGACIYFVSLWVGLDKQIVTAVNKNSLAEGKLPAWVVIAQIIDKNKVSEGLLKADLVYTTFNGSKGNWFGDFGRRNFDEPKKHDPLIMMASLFGGKISVDEKEKIKILESMYDSRYQAQERLWAGDKLETVNLTSSVKFYPESRMAYTEKILSIRNNEKKQWLENQEAIYTFHLSEGSVVSSLSLWIDGREEKARLSTKSKADSAYKTIVGVEQRDPSVIHWQEGNTISVRIFPCNTIEDRKFKIGITSPLKKQGNKLYYQNIYFDGPIAVNANETVQLKFSNKPQSLNLDNNFEEIKQGVYQLDRNYQPDWEISFNAPELSKNNFSFNGYSYHLENYVPIKNSFIPQTIFLDLNKSWTNQEYEQVLNYSKNIPVVVFDNELVLLNAVNKDAIFKKMSKLNFSVFPLYEINTPQNALFITKSKTTSPNLNDLANTNFGDHLTKYLIKKPNIRVFNVGDQLSPYHKTLKEMRVLTYQSGNTSLLAGLLKEKKFITPIENDSVVLMEQSGLIIKKTKEDGIANLAPDHLLRLFAYNHIMKQVSNNYFNKNYVQPNIIAQAEEANIVTPVSSLIVLETKKDYERFNIEESKNSLNNASMKSSGAVPEPHEWLLIMLTASLVIYFFKKPKFNTAA